MNENLLQDNFLFVPDFLEQEKAIELAADFKKFATQENLKEDHQVQGSQTCYNFKPFLKLLLEKTDFMNSLTGLNLLPVYTYSRIYKKGNILKPHVDRNACEISITLNLFGTEHWPFYIKKPNDEEIEMNLNPGQGVVYLGTKAKHWRNEFHGNEYIQVFLHYVNSEGPFAKHAIEFHKWVNKELLK